MYERQRFSGGILGEMQHSVFLGGKRGEKSLLLCVDLAEQNKQD